MCVTMFLSEHVVPVYSLDFCSEKFDFAILECLKTEVNG